VVLLETFLAVESLLADEFRLHLELMEQLYDLQLPRFEKAVNSQAEKQLDVSPRRNAGFFQKKLQLKRLQFEHSDPHQRVFNEHLQAASDALDVFFIVEKLRLTGNMVNFENILNINYQAAFVEEILDWSASGQFREVVAVQVYRGILLLLKNPEEASNFEAVKGLLAAHESCFDPQECKQLYTLLLNFCARRINRFNDERFLYEYLEINKLLLTNGLIFEQEKLPPWRYANLVNVGLKTGQTEWTQEFIYQYKNRLPEDYAENAFHFNLAQLHYHKKDFDRAQRDLLRVDFAEDVLLNTGARSLFIKLYYETGQTELLLSFLEATRLFLHRNQLLDARMKSQMQKFIQYTTKLARLEPFEKDKLEKLAAELPPATEMMHRDWVAERIGERLGLK
jgi:hypothetical protein